MGLLFAFLHILVIFPIWFSSVLLICSCALLSGQLRCRVVVRFVGIAVVLGLGCSDAVRQRPSSLLGLRVHCLGLLHVLVSTLALGRSRRCLFAVLPVVLSFG